MHPRIHRAAWCAFSFCKARVRVAQSASLLVQRRETFRAGVILVAARSEQEQGLVVTATMRHGAFDCAARVVYFALGLFTRGFRSGWTIIEVSGEPHCCQNRRVALNGVVVPQDAVHPAKRRTKRLVSRDAACGSTYNLCLSQATLVCVLRSACFQECKLNERHSTKDAVVLLRGSVVDSCPRRDHAAGVAVG